MPKNLLINQIDVMFFFVFTVPLTDASLLGGLLVVGGDDGGDDEEEDEHGQGILHLSSLSSRNPCCGDAISD